jgi:predicted methyltransferase
MRLTEKVHSILKTELHAGNFAIDATSGNGHDSLLLAELIGTQGRLWAIDAQAQAIAATRERLRSIAHPPHIELLHADHAPTLQALAKSEPKTAHAIIFNLGYLPGSDKTVKTNADTTQIALDASSKILCDGGVLLVTAYRGHSGGGNEAQAVANWMAAHQSLGWQIESFDPNTGQARIPPILWVAHAPTGA